MLSNKPNYILEVIALIEQDIKIQDVIISSCHNVNDKTDLEFFNSEILRHRKPNTLSETLNIMNKHAYIFLILSETQI